MREIDEIKFLLSKLSPDELQEAYLYLRSLLPRHPIEDRLMMSSDAMLEALGRADALTIRMIRGVFAEGAFAAEVVPTLIGWRSLPVINDPPYDFLLTDAPEGEDTVRDRVSVQVKMQRSEKGEPLRASKKFRSWPDDHFVVELQRTRTGNSDGSLTRPYRFGEFDIVAVSLGPSTGHWRDCVYTVGRWLIPSERDAQNIATYQPVFPGDNGFWTADFPTVVAWFRSDKNLRVDDSIEKVKRGVRRRLTDGDLGPLL